MGLLTGVSFEAGIRDDTSDAHYYAYAYQYNANGRVTGQNMTVMAATGVFNNLLPAYPPIANFTATYQWDSEGRMTSIQGPTVAMAPGANGMNPVTLPTGAYQYDMDGRMTGMTWDTGNGSGPQPYASATYGLAGQLTSLSYGAGTETRTYNSLLQLTSQSIPGYMNMTYTYSATQNNGRITGSVDSVTGESTTYSYDALNRLSGASNGLWSASYGYDGFGNLTSKSGAGGAPAMTATYDANNRQVGVSYDANGNPGTANNAWNGYSVENRLNTQTSMAWPQAFDDIRIRSEWETGAEAARSGPE
jgi:YD repeat-containing protein